MNMVVQTPGVGGKLPETAYATRTSGSISFSGNWQQIPLRDADILLETNTDAIELTATGVFTVKNAGHYSCEGLISFSNFPSGTTKFILAVRKNGVLAGYLSRGFTTLPSSDYWGTSGNFSLQCAANDTLQFYGFVGATVTANIVYVQGKITQLS